MLSGTKPYNVGGCSYDTTCRDTLLPPRRLKHLACRGRPHRANSENCLTSCNEDLHKEGEFSVGELHSKVQSEPSSSNRIYVHLRWTIAGPASSYSDFITHISSKVERDARMDPPIHTEYLRSGGATILTVMLFGDLSSISL